MAVTINIEKNEHTFIDGTTGQELTPEQFNQKYSTVNVGGLTRVLSNFGTKEESTENKEL